MADGVLPVVAGPGAEDGFPQVARPHLVREEGPPVDAGLQAVPELGGELVAEDVVAVVDGRDRDVDLGLLIRLVVPRRKG